MITHTKFKPVITYSKQMINRTIMIMMIIKIATTATIHMLDVDSPLLLFSPLIPVVILDIDKYVRLQHIY